MASKTQYYCIEDCFFRNRKYVVGEGPYAFDKLTKSEKLVVEKRFQDKAPAPAKKEAKKSPRYPSSVKYSI